MSNKNKMKSKKFRVATEGATTDGRKISKEWIEQMAKNYDPKKYGARINLEHIKGILPDGPFKAYGDVLSLSTETVDGKLVLVAELSPNDALLAINKDKQKVYTSIEVDPSFADTGEAYLVGLAVTDSPASLGCEMLEFSAKAKANPLADRKINPDNLFTEAVEIDLTFESDKSDEPSLSDKVKEMFAKIKKVNNDESAIFRTDLEKTLEQFVGEIAASQTTIKTLNDNYSVLSNKHEQLQKEFTALITQLQKSPSTYKPRPAASGADFTNETDC